jgi:hypothetical protein
VADPRGRAVQGPGCTGARTVTTQQSGRAPGEEVQMCYCIAYRSGYTEPESPGELLPATPDWRLETK